MLSRWLASLPVQLSQLGHRNPTLSAQLILSIQAAASRGNKDMLNSLQTHASTLYGERTHLSKTTQAADDRITFPISKKVDTLYSANKDRN